MAPFVVPLRSPAATLATAGGKGKSLSQLARAGFPVPAGFVVTTAAYRAFVRETDLQPRILGLAKGDPEADVEEVSAEIRGLFDGGGIPSNVASEIGQAHSALCRDGDLAIPLAVRSSATAEDLPGASFAGQQETYLNVRGEQDLLRAVKRCWSSLWTPRALAYRRRQGIDPGDVGLAVVVQVMVSASAAGVLFTANPLTGARDEVVIDAAWGLGEAVVSGLVTPDHIVVDKATGLVKQIVVAEKTVLTLPTSSGTEQRAVEADKRSAQVLDAAQVAQLVRLGSSIEAHYSEPQDIEWCLAGDQFWIVQSRPITTLPPEPIIWQSPVPSAKWLKDLQAGEWVTEPVSPLGATTTFDTMIAARQRRMPLQRSPWYAVINGWLYMRADFRLLWLATAPIGLAVNLAKGTLNGHRRMRRRWPDRLRMLALLEKSDLAKLSDEELRAHTDRLLAALGWWWWEVTWYTAAAQLGEQVIRKLKVADLADPAVLFRGNDSLLLEAERALRHAADTGQVEAYLARFGHFVESADPIHPTLRESPDLLTQYLAVAGHSDIGPDERLIRSRRERAAAETLVHAVRGPRGFLVRRMLSIGQSCAAHVDDAVFHLQRVLALIRAAFLEAGRRLSGAGLWNEQRTSSTWSVMRCGHPDPIWPLTSQSDASCVNARSGSRRRRSFRHRPIRAGTVTGSGGCGRRWRGRPHSSAARRNATGDVSSSARPAVPVVRMASHGSSPGRTNFTACSPVMCWSPTPQRRFGHPCSTSPPRPSPRWVAPSRTRPSSPASSASHW